MQLFSLIYFDHMLLPHRVERPSSIPPSSVMSVPCCWQKSDLDSGQVAVTRASMRNAIVDGYMRVLPGVQRRMSANIKGFKSRPYLTTKCKCTVSYSESEGHARGVASIVSSHFSSECLCEIARWDNCWIDGNIARTLTDQNYWQRNRITRDRRDRAGWRRLVRCAARAADHHSWWDRERRIELTIKLLYKVRSLCVSVCTLLYFATKFGTHVGRSGNGSHLKKIGPCMARKGGLIGANLRSWYLGGVSIWLMTYRPLNCVREVQLKSVVQQYGGRKGP